MSVGKAYLLNAALDFWGMKNLTDQLAKHAPPPGILFKTSEKKLDYLNEVIGNFVDKYVIVDPDKECNHNGQALDNDERTEQADRVRLVLMHAVGTMGGLESP